jgi:hypothetical protein
MGHLLKGRQGIILRLQHHVCQREVLLEELAGRVFVADGYMRPGNSQVLGRCVENGNRQASVLGGTKIADLDLLRFTCGGRQVEAC